MRVNFVGKKHFSTNRFIQFVSYAIYCKRLDRCGVVMNSYQKWGCFFSFFMMDNRNWTPSWRKSPHNCCKPSKSVRVRSGFGRRLFSHLSQLRRISLTTTTVHASSFNPLWNSNFTASMNKHSEDDKGMYDFFYILYRRLCFCKAAFLSLLIAYD